MLNSEAHRPTGQSEMTQLINEAEIKAEEAKAQLTEALIHFDTLIEIAKDHESILQQLERTLVLLKQINPHQIAVFKEAIDAKFENYREYLT